MENKTICHVSMIRPIRTAASTGRRTDFGVSRTGFRARGIPGKEGDKDHIHILLQYPRGDSIRPIVSILKQESTYPIWRTHHHKMLAQHDWAERPLWSDGYFAASVGNASTETIRQYITSQG